MLSVGIASTLEPGSLAEGFHPTSASIWPRVLPLGLVLEMSAPKSGDLQPFFLSEAQRAPFRFARFSRRDEQFQFRCSVQFLFVSVCGQELFYLLSGDTEHVFVRRTESSRTLLANRSC